MNDSGFPEKGLRKSLVNRLKLKRIKGPRNELTWFTKGLRLCCSLFIVVFNNIERIDLIYEGIATYAPNSLVEPPKDERIDLIYEGIATSGTSYGYK